MGAHDFKLNKVHLFRVSGLKLHNCLLCAQKSVNIYVTRSAALKLALVPVSRYHCDVN